MHDAQIFQQTPHRIFTTSSRNLEVHLHEGKKVKLNDMQKSKDLNEESDPFFGDLYTVPTDQCFIQTG